MLMYHPIKSGCKKISSSAHLIGTVTFDQMSSHCDPEPKKANQSSWRQSHSWCCITIPGLVTEGSAAEEISSRWTFNGIMNLFCDFDLDHNRAIQYFHKTIHLAMMYHQTKFSCKRISNSDNILKSEDSWRDNITIGTWNTRTLRAAEKLQEPTHQMNRYRWNILGLCEMRWKNFGKTTTEEGHKVFFSKKEDKHEHGIGFLVHKDIMNTVIGCRLVSSRPITWGQSLSTSQ